MRFQNLINKHSYKLLFAALVLIITVASNKGDCQNLDPENDQTKNQLSIQIRKNLRYDLGEFVITTETGGLHYVVAEVEIDFDGPNKEEIEEKREELREVINDLFVKSMPLQVYEDGLDKTIQEDLLKKIQKVLDNSVKNQIKINKIQIRTYQKE